jgi:hypothetical protein
MTFNQSKFEAAVLKRIKTFEICDTSDCEMHLRTEGMTIYVSEGESGVQVGEGIPVRVEFSLEFISAVREELNARKTRDLKESASLLNRWVKHGKFTRD